MDKWILPDIIKLYEAFWCIADARIEILKVENSYIEAKVLSSSLLKHYIVKFQKDKGLIMSNDNGSYYMWYLWYPSISLLLYLWIIDLDNKIINLFKGIKWKDINVKNNNDFVKTKNEVDLLITKTWIDIKVIEEYCNYIFSEIKNINLWIYWEKVLPPNWY